MVKRTLYFGKEAYLKTKDEQLIVSYPDKSLGSKSVPIEDIGVLIFDHYRLTYTQSLLSKLLQNNCAIIICDEKHLPHGLMLNLNGHHTQNELFRYQIDASKPLCKQLWQQTIQSKIKNQAQLLESLGYSVENLIRWSKQVKSGDPENLEGRAARVYWQKIFSDQINEFKRGRFEEAPNNLLNYGYTILRSVVARNLVASGLLPTLGIHHHNKYNAYCLADDIMEPYRPFVDELVVNIMEDQSIDIELLSPAIKQQLLQIPVIDVKLNKKRFPLMVACEQTTASLVECFKGSRNKIKYPSFV